MYLILTLVLFLGFLGNVLAGSLRGAPVIGDVGEMLLLLGTSIAFVLAIARAERDARDPAARAAPAAPAVPATSGPSKPTTGESNDPS